MLLPTPPVSPEKCRTVFSASLGAHNGDGSRSPRAGCHLQRPGFFEALIRLAAIKYVRLGPYDSLAQGLDNLITDNLKVGGPLPAEARHDVTAYRTERLYQEGTDTALSRHLPMLQVSLTCHVCCRHPGVGLVSHTYTCN